VFVQYIRENRQKAEEGKPNSQDIIKELSIRGDSLFWVESARHTIIVCGCTPETGRERLSEKRK
jgi:hypothetical protein